MSAPDTALVSRSPGETWVALLSHDVVWELHLFRDTVPQPGDIYLGRLRRRLPAGSAAFVDLGTSRDGFLPSEDTLSGLRPEGAAVLVQVTQGPRGDKGPKLSGVPSLAGEYVVYSPFVPGASVSSRIAHKTERKRLQAWADARLGEGEGIVVRTSAFQVSEDVLDRELASQRTAWQGISTSANAAKSPRRLSIGALPLAAALAGRPVDVVLAEGPGAAEEARAARPDLAERVRAVDGWSLFDEEGVSEAIEQATARTLPLPRGATLAIEETAAVTAIDVDTGPAGADAANRAAVVEIARQVRLRGLAGQIVVDFAAPHKGAAAAKRALADALRTALADDPMRPHVLGVSPMGLVEVRRIRGRPPLSDLLLAGMGERLPSPETAALGALRRVLAASRSAPGAQPRLVTGPVVADLLQGELAAARRDTERLLGHPLVVEARAGLRPGAADVIV